MNDSTGAAFEIPGAEGELIRGNVHLPRRGEPDHGAGDRGGRLPVLLILHGFKGYKDYGFFPYLTQRLAEGGLATVRFNFSHGGIDDDPSTFGRPDLFERDSWSRQVADVRAVIGAAEAGRLPHADRMDLSRLALLGHSRGGVTALLTAGSDSRVKAVVTLAAPSSADNLTAEQRRTIRERGHVVSPSSRTGQALRIGRAWLNDLEQNAAALDLRAAVGRMSAALLIVNGTADGSVPAACAEEIAAAYSHRAETLLLDGAGHTFDCANPFAGPSRALEQLIGRVSAFLGEHLSAGGAG